LNKSSSEDFATAIATLPTDSCQYAREYPTLCIDPPRRLFFGDINELNKESNSWGKGTAFRIEHIIESYQCCLRKPATSLPVPLDSLVQSWKSVNGYAGFADLIENTPPQTAYSSDINFSARCSTLQRTDSTEEPHNCHWLRIRGQIRNSSSGCALCLVPCALILSLPAAITRAADIPDRQWKVPSTYRVPSIYEYPTSISIFRLRCHLGTVLTNSE
jgi:hypothetical protein